jgi:hypothetical protein
VQGSYRLWEQRRARLSLQLVDRQGAALGQAVHLCVQD